MLRSMQMIYDCKFMWVRSSGELSLQVERFKATASLELWREEEEEKRDKFSQSFSSHLSPL